MADRLGLDPGSVRDPSRAHARLAGRGRRQLRLLHPDHEPGLGAPLTELDEEWISGLGLARRASLLIHDCQYTDEEYPAHIGWGHSPLSDTLVFAHRAQADRLPLFHHDPLHDDDFLDVLGDEVVERASEFAKAADWAQLAREACEVELQAARRAARAR